MEKEKKNIYEKLSQVQNELKAPKGQKNTFGNYRYRSAEDILEAVKPILKKNDLTIIISDTLENIGERYYIKATVSLCDLDMDERIQVNAYAREEETKKGMDASQITGTASSYARKYALNGLFNIDDTKDADTDEYTKRTKEEPTNDLKTIPISQERLDTIRELIEETKTDLKKFLSYYELKSLKDINVGNVNKIEEALYIKKTKKESE